MALYFSETDYRKLVAALVNVEPCPFAGAVTPDQIMIALGEHGDIWPETIRRDVIRSSFSDARIYLRNGLRSIGDAVRCIFCSPTCKHVI